MLFNSLDFAIFLPIVFSVYWILNTSNLRLQNAFLVLASYVFYGWWDWRFLGLVFISTLTGYLTGLGIEQSAQQRRKWFWLLASIVINLGLLGFYKYYNFFADSFNASFSFLGSPLIAPSLQLILPIGISFYTFQTLSYSIDIYRGSIKATRDLIAFSAFHSFFPQLVAGPIERATNLLPQFYVRRSFDYGQAVDGLRQILWGLFKKVVIADNCAVFANTIFSDPSAYSASTLVLGALFFTFQIYGDFSGYSDIAIGVARLLGFNLMQNFAFPYFSRDIAEFWRRWHISLSTWFRDYVYIPLGGSRGGTWLKIRNIFVIFLASGLWHGANWTFVIWGALNALYYLPVVLLGRNRDHLEIVAQGRLLPSFKEVLQIGLTFALTVFAWIFFRAESLSHALTYIAGLFSPSLFSVPNFPGDSAALTVIPLVIIFLLIEWWGREHSYAIERLGVNWGRVGRWSFYYALAILIINFTRGDQMFIYFQF
ncbi:MAG: MBOAT family protein [Oscillochloris sp.]|nr:MBOAT family protein [Oscillochloris sp.]